MQTRQELLSAALRVYTRLFRVVGYRHVEKKNLYNEAS